MSASAWGSLVATGRRRPRLSRTSRSMAWSRVSPSGGPSSSRAAGIASGPKRGTSASGRRRRSGDALLLGDADRPLARRGDRRRGHGGPTDRRRPLTGSSDAPRGRRPSRRSRHPGAARGATARPPTRPADRRGASDPGPTPNRNTRPGRPKRPLRRPRIRPHSHALLANPRGRSVPPWPRRLAPVHRARRLPLVLPIHRRPEVKDPDRSRHLRQPQNQSELDSLV